MSDTVYRPRVYQHSQAKGIMISLALPREPLEAHYLIVAGMVPSIVNELATLLNCDTKTVCQVAGIGRSTFARKIKSAALLSQGQSACVYMFAKVMDAAESLCQGDREKAFEWLNTPARAFGGKLPATFLTTAVGAQAVMDLIGQIEHGVVI